MAAPNIVPVISSRDRLPDINKRPFVTPSSLDFGEANPAPHHRQVGMTNLDKPITTAMGSAVPIMRFFLGTKGALAHSGIKAPIISNPKNIPKMHDPRKIPEVRSA
ncbi:hypothetical protein ACFSUK_31170 [Sphingobium scionense]